jgi:hypothetical protein
MRFRILLKPFQCFNIRLYLCLFLVNHIQSAFQLLLIVLHLRADVFPRLMHQVPVMLPLDTPSS